MSAEVDRYVENCPQVIGEARPGAQQRSAAREGGAAAAAAALAGLAPGHMF